MKAEYLPQRWCVFEGVRMFTTSLNWLMPTRHWVVDYRRKLRYFGCGKIDGYTSLPAPFTLGCPVTYINVINCDSPYYSAMLILVRRGRLEIRDEISGLRLTPHTYRLRSDVRAARRANTYKINQFGAKCFQAHVRLLGG